MDKCSAPRPHRVIDALTDLPEAQALAALLALDRSGPGWRNRVSLLNLGGEMLGGHIAALGLRAAAMPAASQDNRAGVCTEVLQPSAVHVLFAARPVAAEPCDITVETLRSGRRFVLRRVELRQGERLVAQLTVTLTQPQLAQSAPDYHYAPPMPAAPPPETLPSRAKLLARPEQCGNALFAAILAGHPYFDIRYIPDQASTPGTRRFWLRVPALAHAAPDDVPEIVQACLFLLFSDFWCGLPLHWLPGSRAALGETFGTVSLDHAAWIHFPPDCGAWSLWESDGHVPGGGTAMMQVRAWSADGRLVGSFLQQALVQRETAHR